MKHSIVELISNRIVYHTGGSNGPGNNSDGSGDEHADGSRSSNGSFGSSAGVMGMIVSHQNRRLKRQ
ncbi:MULTISPECIES: hypothetical protein [Thalassospira]|jgi:hypothetical protein|uniref:hypothetical protein n=1 Tax=Thalassospira TaxID=168934 RepID=UPI001113CC7F|nr:MULTISPECIES: hypothetical protein [Thalassospira]MDM7976011.1 hypothetical protein [Thalassospira xiamenensis]|tara:strand:- start:90 stop:290 length:201 start_codon:yes stop_codon:yes gene_type:complete